ncbi:hypothetical protein D3C79_803170 [compost metagenome]
MTLQVHGAQPTNIPQARHIETHYCRQVLRVGNELLHLIVNGLRVQWRTLIPTAPIQFH